MKNKAFKLALTIVIAGALVFGASFARAQTSNEDMVKMLQSLIQMLLQMVAQLQAQLAQKITTTTTIPILQQTCDSICEAKGYQSGNCIGSSSEGVSPTCPVGDINIGQTTGCSKAEAPSAIGMPTCCCSNKIKYSCMTAIGTLVTNWYSTCIPDSNGTFNSLEECQKICGTTSGCTDSDGGWNLYQKGTIYINNQAVCTDSCETSQKLIECSCGNPSGGGPDLGYSKSQINCPSGYTCQDGACKPTTTASITVLSPNGGEKCEMGKTCQIKWSPNNISSDKKINIQLSYFYPSTQSPLEAVIASQINNTGVYDWTIPTSGIIADVIVKSDPNAYRIRLISTSEGSNAEDYSNSYFSIMPPTPTTSLTCSDLMITYYRQYYINICKNGGFDSVCFNKYTGVYQGCGKSTYNDCTANNVNASQNISCDVIPSTCTDSDGGKNIYVKGTTTFRGQVYTETCETSTVVNEYYCQNGEMMTETPTCPSGYTCQDGACKPAVPVVTVSVDLKVNGSDNPAAVPYGSIFNASWTSTGATNCSASGHFIPLVDEGLWTDLAQLPTSGTKQLYAKHATYGYMSPLQLTIQCWNTSGQQAKDDIFVNVTPTQITCIDSDGGDNIYTKGSITIKNSKGGQWIYTDYCQGTNALQEYNCLANTANYTEDNASNAYLLSYHACPSGYLCMDGACKPTVATTIPPVATTIPSYGRCSDGSACSWCGNQCTKVISGVSCADVMPPSGATCTCVNNTCTIQYSSSTNILMDALNKLSASLISLIELLKR